MRQNRLVLPLLLSLIGAAILRSAVATRLDSFTYDEPWHIGAAAAYARTGDFRLNPEHPPLVKLWTGAFLRGFELSPYRPYADKYDERAAVENDVYFKNDPDAVRRRTRIAMFTFNGLLLLGLALAVRRLMGDVAAVATTAFLAIDPTVAAHLPVAMTDLPVALLSATAVLLAIVAFRTGRPADLGVAALALGLALGTKHSALVTLAAVALIGAAMSLVRRDGETIHRRRRLGSVVALVAGAFVVLWALYFFRFAESPGTAEEQFNRPLARKIEDVRAPAYRAALGMLAAGHVFPRAYTWGLADTVRAGAEGRAISILAFGELHYSRAPFYFFPGVIAAKLPLGLLVLVALGAWRVLARRIPPDRVAPLAALATLAAMFLVALGSGSSFAGIRHALPLVPPLAVLAAFAVEEAVSARRRVLRGAVAVAGLAAVVSAAPVVRPWEYFNELAGGTAGAHRYFNDEGVDLGLRSRELVAYYERHLKPRGEVPYVLYFAGQTEWRRRGLDWVGRDPARDLPKIFAETAEGTFFVGANQLAPALWWDVGRGFRGATPADRFGNVFVFRGTFPIPPPVQSIALYRRALHGKIRVAKPDLPAAIEMLKRSVALDPAAFGVAIELGNQCVKVGDRECAARAYALARDHAPPSAAMAGMLEAQLARLQTQPLDQVQPLRNPGAE